MKRIHEDITRREMTMIRARVLPEHAELYKELCKSEDTSINAEIEKFIASKLRAAGKIK